MGAKISILEPYLWTLGAIAIIAGVTFYPLAYSFYLSLTNYSFGLSNISFLGFENYIKAVNSQEFINSLKISTLYVVSCVAIEFILGLGSALLLNTINKGAYAIRVLITLPVTITPVVAGLMWKWIMEPEVGILNYLLSLVGVPKQMWLGDPKLALWSIVFADIWKNTPFVIIVTQAGLASIPANLYEAASIDGAGAWVRFKWITLPYLRPAMFVVLLSCTSTAFKVFDSVYMLTQGGPGNLTQVLSLLIYQTGFKFSHLAYASALSYLMFVIVTFIAILYLKVVYPKGE